MQGDAVTIRLNMPDQLVEGQRQEGDTLVVTVRYRCPIRSRPRRGRATSQVCPYRRQTKNYASL